MNPGRLVHIALNYGALSGLSCFGMFLLLYFLGFNPLGSISIVGIWIPVVFICLSTKTYRENELEGFMSYKQGIKIGFFTALSGGLLFAFLIYIFGRIIDENLVENYKKEFIVQLEATKSFFSDKMYDMYMTSINEQTMSKLAFSEFISKAIGGLIVSLITAAIFKKQPPITQS